MRRSLLDTSILSGACPGSVMPTRLAAGTTPPGEWAAWSECSATCDGGQMSRSRKASFLTYSCPVHMGFAPTCRPHQVQTDLGTRARPVHACLVLRESSPTTAKRCVWPGRALANRTLWHRVVWTKGHDILDPPAVLTSFASRRIASTTNGLSGATAQSCALCAEQSFCRFMPIVLTVCQWIKLLRVGGMLPMSSSKVRPCDSFF